MKKFLMSCVVLFGTVSLTAYALQDGNKDKENNDKIECCCKDCTCKDCTCKTGCTGCAECKNCTNCCTKTCCDSTATCKKQ